MIERLDPDGSVEVLELRVHVAQVLLELSEFTPARTAFAEALDLGTRLLPDSASVLANALKGIQEACTRSNSWADGESAVLAAGRGVFAFQGLPKKARARALASVASFYRAWNASEPSPERFEHAAEWDAKR
jgi:hypothetical protein